MSIDNLYVSHNIANLIKRTAKEKKIAIKIMLEELELGSNTMSSMNHGKMISAGSLARIADYLDVSVDFLLGRTENAEFYTSLQATYDNASPEIQAAVRKLLDLTE